MAGKIDKYILKNGMAILGEPIEAVSSAAFGFMIPAGAAVMPQGCCGAANVIADWIFRGVANKNSRQLSDALDSLGLHRAASLAASHITIAAVMEAANLTEAIKLYADIILRPKLQIDQFKPARKLAVDELAALDDDPRQKVMLKLKEQFYPSPLGRSTLGEPEDLKALTPEKTKQIIRDNFNLSRTIMSVAGKYDFEEIVRLAENLFENGSGKKPPDIKLEKRTTRYTHIHADSAQVHIGLMCPTVAPSHRQYYNARMAVSVLSGGMSARLFTEVREKRGLCYAIGAKYHCMKQAAGVMCYAGTTPQKAQQTIDVIIAEFDRLGEKISRCETERARAGLKSTAIMQSESSASRSDAIANDYYILGRVRTLDEIKAAIEQTTAESMMKFLKDNRFGNFTVVTIGPKELNIS